MREEIISSSSDLLRSGVIIFPEPGLEVIDYVQSADVGVLLTNTANHAEGCSNSIMEYMACGLPVICTNNGGNAEIIENDVNGYLIPPFSVNELSFYKLEYFQTHPGSKISMGLSGSQKIKNIFSIPQYSNNVIQLYSELL